jgi:ribosomal-protein-alanine N-acetyltransferase
MEKKKPPESISTGRLILRKPRLEDAESIFRNYASDSEVTRFLVWRPHSQLDQTREFISACIRSWQEEERFPFVICQAGSVEAIGMIELRLEEFKADIGYVLARNYWGRGYMTEALRALIAWCFEQPWIYRVWAVCDTENLASARVMEKAGLQREGRLRREIIHPNITEVPRDVYIYSLVK